MREIGRIKLVQVQRSPMKRENSLYSYYDPAPLLVVECLLPSSKGVIGLTAGGRQIVDVHHVDHPQSRNSRGKNGISIGFTSHYQAMRDRFGEQVVDGCAGENVLVETEETFRLADLGERLAIQNQQTGQFVYLTSFKVAAPCVEFTQYAANHGMPLPPEQLKSTLQFLDGGRRGFYATVVDQDEVVAIQAGDRVFVSP